MDDIKFKKRWPADVHLVGKDILTTHAVYWSTILMALGLKLPKMLFAHGWWTVNGEKMSKSRGNVVDPAAAAAEYGVDAFRYFLLREVPFGQDGDFSRTAMTLRYNSELANDLGNLYSRALAMIERYSGGTLPRPHAKCINADDRWLKKKAEGLYHAVGAELDRLAFHRALQQIWEVTDLANRYVDSCAPWELAKKPDDRPRLETVLYHLGETLRLLALHLHPFMPDITQGMADGLGWDKDLKTALFSKERKWGLLKPGSKVKKGAPLFPRIEEKAVALVLAPDKPEMKPMEKAMETTQTQTPYITLDEFKKIDLRVGRITAAEKVAGADKLLKLAVNIGTETRQVISGIAQKYSPEELVGRLIIIVANLKPAVIRGVESQGMLIGAGDTEFEGLATFTEPVKPGAKIR